MKPQKLYYSIGEVEKILGETNTVIRHWEDNFSHIKPRRSVGGTRQFTQEDIDNLKLIQYLIREKQLTIPGVKKELKKQQSSLILRQTAIKQLKSVLSKLEDLRATIQEQS